MDKTSNNIFLEWREFMKILVTGGLGYIGSNTVVELLNSKYEVVIIDNLYNAKEEAYNYINRLSKHDCLFIKLDAVNYEDLNALCKTNNFDGIIHFAGYKAVGESVEKPLMYYHNNLRYQQSTLLELLLRIIFVNLSLVLPQPYMVMVNHHLVKRCLF